MRHLINRSIGAGLDNDPDDIRIVRGILKATKGEDVIPEALSGFINDELDADIRDFQQKAGLIEDGKLTPDGETERNLISRITGEGIDFATREDAVLRRSVGDGGENDAADVIAAKRVLGTLGYLKYDRTAPPSPFIDAKTVAALNEFQNDTKLFPDGRADPGGETIEALRELLGKTANRRSSDETQVALGPVLFPLFMFLASKAPHIVKFARGAAAVGAIGNAANQPVLTGKNRQRQGDPDEGSDFTGERSKGSKVENIPPDPNRFGGNRTEFPPEEPDKNHNKQEGRPVEPVANIPIGFPMPENPENLVEIFPGNTIKPELPLIIERRGKESTRAFNAEVVRELEKRGKKIGFLVKHVGGSRDADGREVPETHLKNRDTGGLKGGNFIDLTVIIPGRRDIPVHINTADTRVDGKTLSTREERAAIRILYNMEDDAFLITIPKAAENETIDIDALGALLEPIMRNLKEFADGNSDRDAIEKWINLNVKLPTK